MRAETTRRMGPRRCCMSATAIGVLAAVEKAGAQGLCASQIRALQLQLDAQHGVKRTAVAIQHMPYNLQSMGYLRRVGSGTESRWVRTGRELLPMDPAVQAELKSPRVVPPARALDHERPVASVFDWRGSVRLGEAL